jgi:hypothetical protein
MMETGFIAIILVALLGILIMVFLVARNRGLDIRRDEYRTYFIIGISFLPIGLATDNMAFTALGIIFMILGLTNRDKWQDM